MNARSLSAIILIAIAVGVFCITLYRALYVSPQDGEQSSALASSTATVPVELKIPALNIDAKVQQVGLAKSGNLGIPSNFTDVAWYKDGPAPGTPGNAIIDGHVDNAVSLPGVFKHLNSIAVGDEIDVVDASGTPIVFTVTRTESLPYNSTSTADIFGPTKTPGLVLITCGGTWEQPIREYSDRLIVFSTLSSGSP